MAAAKKPAAKPAAKTAPKPRTRKPAAAKAAKPEAAAAAKAPTARKASKPRPATAKATTPRNTKPRTPAAAKAKAPQGKTRPHVGLISAVTVGLIAAGSAIALFGRRLFAPGNAEHPAPDLALDQPHNDGSHRAPDAFRPDPTAPVPASEREGLRPATGPLPSMVTH